MCPDLYLFELVYRCQHSIRSSANQLWLWCPSYRSWRSYREVFHHQRCHQNGTLLYTVFIIKVIKCKKAVQCPKFMRIHWSLSWQQYRKIPEGIVPPSTPKFAYGPVQMKKVKNVFADLVICIFHNVYLCIVFIDKFDSFLFDLTVADSGGVFGYIVFIWTCQNSLPTYIYWYESGMHLNSHAFSILYYHTTFIDHDHYCVFGFVY